VISRKVINTLSAIVLIGLGVALVPFLATRPERTNDAPEQEVIRLADLKTGSFVEVEMPSSRVFVLRDFDNEVYVFSVPYSDTAYWLPEFDWSHPAVPCARFEPDNKDGMLVPDGKFRCVLPDHGEFFRYEHSWSYSGENQGYRTSDMKVAIYDRTVDFIVLTRWD